ncbi:hypothetical protein ACLM5J_10440 [Nocardioides sp. Bht2]|uniref:hypothetical protein n=1 Tax=Nocardioides sp. Bht2 TaxID=3392297 RepID=UPI0039B5C4F0
MSSGRLVPAALALVLSFSLVACGGDDKEKKAEPKAETSQPSATDGATPTQDASGMTVWGATLAFGDAARFTWKPRRKIDGVVEVAVSSVKQVTMDQFSGFKLDDAMRKSTPYFVTVKATNIGDSDLGGIELPLFLDNGSDVLHPPANIAGKFKPCGNSALPDEFQPNATADLCLVFLAVPETSMRAVALQTTESPQPITWTGAIEKPAKKGKKGAKKKGAKKKS